MKQKESVDLPKKSLFPDWPDPFGVKKKRRCLPSNVESKSVTITRKPRKQLFY